MRKARNILWIIFIVSIIFLISVSLLWDDGETSAPNLPATGGDNPLIVWVPLITALVSLIGALTSSILTMRRDRLESRKVEMEVTKLQLEIERLKKDAGGGRNESGSDPDN